MSVELKGNRVELSSIFHEKETENVYYRRTICSLIDPKRRSLSYEYWHNYYRGRNDNFL